MSALLDAALAYADIDWPVFPLRPQSKVPLLKKADGGNGVHDATTDRALIREWWQHCPTANIGLAAVPFWVLDVDKPDPAAGKPGGGPMFTYIIGEYGRLPRTVKQFTSGLGFHVLFKADPRIINSVGFLPGLDTRAAGGYIVAAPSIHPNGQHYRWATGHSPHDVELAEAPDWMIALAEPLEEPAQPEADQSGQVTFMGRVLPNPGYGSAYGDAALNSACAAVSSAPIGEQNTILDHQAYGIGQLVAGGVLHQGTAFAELVAAGMKMHNQQGRQPWTRKGIEQRVERQFGKAASKPRSGEVA